MKERRIKGIFAVPMLFVMIFVLMQQFVVPVNAESRTMPHRFSISTSRTRTGTINIPSLVRITSMTVDTGTVTYSVSGNNVTITCKNGSAVDSEPDDKYISSYSHHTGETQPPSTYYYDIGGYSGTLSLYRTENNQYTTNEQESRTFTYKYENYRGYDYDQYGNITDEGSFWYPDSQSVYPNGPSILSAAVLNMSIHRGI